MLFQIHLYRSRPQEGFRSQLGQGRDGARGESSWGSRARGRTCWETVGTCPGTPREGGLGAGALTDRFVSLGTKFSTAEEEESAGSIPKRKRKKKKKNHLRPEHFGLGGEATCPEQNGSREPEAGPGRAREASAREARAREASAAELGTVATPGPQEQSGLEPTSLHSRRKRLRKRSLRVQVEGPEGAAPAPAGGAPVLKRRRELGALLVNGSGPPTPAWPLPRREGPPASPADRGDCPAIPPQGGKLKKRRGEPGGLDLYDPSAQKAAILKKRKKMKEMSKLAEHRGVKLVQALVRRPRPGRGCWSSPAGVSAPYLLSRMDGQGRGQPAPGPGSGHGSGQPLPRSKQ